MTEERERYCPKCERVFSWEDWQEDNCPFCEVALAELGVGQAAPVLDDTLSSGIPWPQGEREVEVFRAGGYMEAQVIKAVLESGGIPVLLLSSSQLGFTVGSLGMVPILVPKSRREEALDLLAEHVK